jgi:hypothetical protein
MEQAAGSRSRSPTPDLKVDLKPKTKAELIKAFENERNPFKYWSVTDFNKSLRLLN